MPIIKTNSNPPVKKTPQPQHLPKTPPLSRPSGNAQIKNSYDTIKQVNGQDEDLLIEGYEAPRKPMVPEGEHIVTVESIERAGTKLSRNGNNVPMISIIFKTGRGHKVYYKIPFIMRDGYPLVHMLESGFDYAGGGFDLKTLIGKKCVIRIVHYEAKNGNIWENVAAILSADNATVNKRGPGMQHAPSSTTEELDDLY